MRSALLPRWIASLLRQTQRLHFQETAASTLRVDLRYRISDNLSLSKMMPFFSSFLLDDARIETLSLLSNKINPDYSNEDLDKFLDLFLLDEDRKSAASILP